jgi:hypothetical protein
MLKIENTHKLLDEIVTLTPDIKYRIYNIGEQEDHYTIYVTDDNGPFGIEMLILKRNKTNNQNGFVYQYYTMYDSDMPNNRLNLAKGVIEDKSKFLNSIKQILEMK